MKAFVTGGTGFIGEQVVERLRARGDDVVALVRSPDKAARLNELGCQLVEGDLSSEQAIRAAVQGCDAVFHIAAVYKVGIPKSQHEPMYESNVRGTERVLDAAIEAGVPKIVYVSTVGVFGNTNGEIVQEGYRHKGDFNSYYEETKYKAHQVALDRIAKGAPIVVAQPGGVYGPNDHSELGNMIDQARTGKLKMKLFPESGFNFVYVDDVADGIVLTYDKGAVGECYVLGGELATIGDLVEKTCEIAGRKAPSKAMPVGLMKMAVPVGPLVGKAMGFPPNLRELIKSSDNVTYWASSDKAKQQLGYSPRELDDGLRETLAAT